MTTPSAYLLTSDDPEEEATVTLPDGTRETVSGPMFPRAFGISLAVRGYVAPWPITPGNRYRLQPLPEVVCPPWCPGTLEAHTVESDDLARAYLEHARHLSVAAEASVALRQVDGWHPQWCGSPVLAVLGDDLTRDDALALAEALTSAAEHLPEGSPAARDLP